LLIFSLKKTNMYYFYNNNNTAINLYINYYNKNSFIAIIIVFIYFGITGKAELVIVLLIHYIINNKSYI